MEIDDLVISACKPEQAPAVLELWHEARSEHATTPDRLEDVLRMLEELPGSLIVATHELELVGSLIAAWDGWRGNMYRLAVRADLRRSGVGIALVRAGEEHLRERGATRITALVAREDPVAAAFWERAGYPCDRWIGRRVRNI